MFAIRNLSILAYANGFTLWHYKTKSDDREVVQARGYFDDAREMMQTGDHLHITGGGAAPWGGVYWVEDNAQDAKAILLHQMLGS